MFLPVLSTADNNPESREHNCLEIGVCDYPTAAGVHSQGRRMCPRVREGRTQGLRSCPKVGVADSRELHSHPGEELHTLQNKSCCV